MTVVVTAEQCLSAIQGDSAWRKKEITSLRTRIDKAQGESQSTLIRAGVLLLYAHWEGYVTHAAETYVNHINERVRRFGAPLSDHYRQLLMWRCLKRIGEFPHEKSPIGFLDAMTQWHNNPDSVLEEDMIDMESNLSSKVLKKVLRIVDMSFDEFESKQHLIDEKLLGRRNPIAHGRRKSLTIDEYHEADREVRELIAIFERKIEKCVLGGAFLESAA